MIQKLAGFLNVIEEYKDYMRELKNLDFDQLKVRKNIARCYNKQYLSLCFNYLSCGYNSLF